MKLIITFLLPITTCAVQVNSLTRQQLCASKRRFIALTHVRVIDGTAAPDDQTVLITEERFNGSGRGEPATGKCADNRSEGLHRPAGTRRHA